MLEDVISRLDAKVGDLRSVEGAAAFQQVMDRKRQPQHSVSAYVIPLGMRGQEPNAVAGMFRQPVTDVVGVVLMIGSHDTLGKKALGRLDPFIREIIAAIAGWGPPKAIGVFQLSRAALVSINAGILTYQIDFSVNDQLRIAT